MKWGMMRTPITLLVCATVLLGGAVAALAAVEGTTPRNKTPPGWEAAKTISLATGVAISPLLGVGAYGAYEYWKRPKEARASLPWYSQPWFFVPALLLVGIAALKDALGSLAPTVIKKPFDVAEAIENKISGLIAIGAFIPLIVTIFPGTPGTASITAAGFAAISGSAIGNALLTPFFMAAFVFVWLASHAINMLILLSPFTMVDTALKLFRLAVLGLLAGASFANPYAGAALGLLIIGISYLVAGWSFRLTIFGSIYTWDFVTVRRRRFQPGAESNRMFTAIKLEGAPVRTYGKLVHSPGGRLRFEYRPWLVLKRRSFELQEGPYVVGRGLFFPEIDRRTDDRPTPIFILPPRFLTHEEALARAYGFPEVSDVGLLKGIKAMWRWARNFVAGQSKANLSVIKPAA